MIKDIEKLLIEGNLRFQWKINQDLESIKVEDKIPKYPVLILTCMDTRIDIHRIFQLKPGDVFILKNAGNIYTQDMLRSILITIIEYNIKDIIVLGHLDCGMTKINLWKLNAKLPYKFLSNSHSNAFDDIRDFFKPFSDELKNIKEQVKIIKKINEFLPGITVTGMLYDVNTGWVFEDEKFKEFAFIENFRKHYKKLLTEKNDKFIDFLNTIENKSENKGEDEIVNIDDSKRFSQEGGLNKLETKQSPKKMLDKNMVITNTPEISTKNTDSSDIESQKFEFNQNHRIQISIQKIKIPKIQFQGIKIHLPKIYRNKRDFYNEN